MSVCNKCDKDIRVRQKKISCTTCNLEFHTKCQGVSDLKHEVLMENADDILWFCNSCRVVTANVIHKLSEFELRIKQMESNEEQLKQELKVMHGIVTKLIEKNKSMDEIISKIKVDVDEAKENEKTTKKHAENLMEELSSMKCKLYNQAEQKKIDTSKAKEKMDTLEQESKLNNLRFAGIPEEEDEILKEKILNIVKVKLNLNVIGENDIDLCYRLGKSSVAKVRDVMVKFTSREKRNLIYRCRRTMPRQDPPIFINEDLTVFRNKLFYDARCKKKSNLIHSVWTQEGSIVIKVTDTSEPVVIRSHVDLRNAVFDDSWSVSDCSGDTDCYSDSY